jgi:hypothetical protein
VILFPSCVPPVHDQLPAVYPDGPVSPSVYVSALKTVPLLTGVWPDRLVGESPVPVAVSVQAVARAVPPVSVVTV